MTRRRLLHIVDDEAIVRASIVSLVEAHGDYDCREYGSGESFLAALAGVDPAGLDPGCVVLDLQLDGASGMTVMRTLQQWSRRFPMIVVTGFSDLPTAIEAFRAGAVEVLHKPYAMRPLLDAIDRGFHILEQGGEPPDLVAAARARLARLTPVEAQILARLVRGQTNQDIAGLLALDARAVQLHRARALATIEASSILVAMRTVVIAGWPYADGSAAR